MSSVLVRPGALSATDSSLLADSVEVSGALGTARVERAPYAPSPAVVRRFVAPNELVPGQCWTTKVPSRPARLNSSMVMWPPKICRACRGGAGRRDGLTAAGAGIVVQRHSIRVPKFGRPVKRAATAGAIFWTPSSVRRMFFTVLAAVVCSLVAVAAGVVGMTAQSEYKTRSGRAVRAPERFEPQEQVEDDYGEEEHDDESMHSSEISSEISLESEDMEVERTIREEEGGEDDDGDDFIVEDEDEDEDYTDEDEDEEACPRDRRPGPAPEGTTGLPVVRDWPRPGPPPSGGSLLRLHRAVVRGGPLAPSANLSAASVRIHGAIAAPAYAPAQVQARLGPQLWRPYDDPAPGTTAALAWDAEAAEPALLLVGAGSAAAAPRVYCWVDSALPNMVQRAVITGATDLSPAPVPVVDAPVSGSARPECLACMERPPALAMIPCGHVALCAECWEPYVASRARALQEPAAACPFPGCGRAVEGRMAVILP
eukprot:tig00000492_g1390.t1